METQGYTYLDQGQVKLAETTIKRVKVVHGFLLAPGRPARAGEVVGMPAHQADEQIRIGNAEPYIAARPEASTVQTRDPVANQRDPQIQRRSKR